MKRKSQASARTKPPSLSQLSISHGRRVPSRLRRVVRSAGRTLVLFSGGEKQDEDDAVVRKVGRYMAAGATGVMFGRNMWLRKFDKALALTGRVHRVMARHSR